MNIILLSGGFQLCYHRIMKTIKLNDTGVAVEDVQQRLAVVGLLPDEGIDGVYGQGTADCGYAHGV